MVPCGGALVDLVLPPEAREAARARADRLPSIRLSERALCDVECLATGAFSPLDRFMGRADLERVLGEMRLAAGHLFPIPVTLPVDASEVRLDAEVALRSPRNDLVAILRVEEAREWSAAGLARAALGTEDPRHPLVAEMRSWGRVNVSGRLEVIALPPRAGFAELRLSPRETRARLERLGRPRVVAFQTRNPLHRAHEELTRRAAEALDATLLLHPAVGLTKPGDVDHATRVRACRALVRARFEPGRVLLALLPLAMRLAGPREALWHALIRRNHGATHLIVGRDHASPGVDSAGRPFWGPYDAQALVARHAAELGVAPVPFEELVYLPDEDRYEEASRVPAGARTLSLSGTEARGQYLDRGRPLPAWFTRPEVAEVLAEAYPPRHRQGACVWLTGLPCAGKSTTADLVTALLLERGRRVTVLDGDVVRTHLSRGLGFSREDRDENVRRIGFVAAEVARHGGIAVCAAVSPYRAARDEVRALLGGERFLEVHVDAPVEVCEARDLKGLYAKARRGELRGFTGVDDPYEAPLAPELRLDAAGASAEANARRVIALLEARGLVRAEEA
jgi:sulfate adenylyltransferase